MKLIDFFTLKWFKNFDDVPEYKLAHELRCPMMRDKISREYNEKYKKTPLTHPEEYDPLNPPSGWAYDPYYECWLKNAKYESIT